MQSFTTYAEFAYSGGSSFHRTLSGFYTHHTKTSVREYIFIFKPMLWCNVKQYGPEAGISCGAG